MRIQPLGGGEKKKEWGRFKNVRGANHEKKDASGSKHR